MKVARHKKLYFPALIILATVFVMLILIGISTVQNFNRQKRTTQDMAHHQGIALLQALEAGALSAMVMHREGADALGFLVDQLAMNEDIAYILVIDADGSITHHSASGQPDKHVAWMDLHGSEKGVIARVHRGPDGSAVYELAKRLDTIKSIPEDENGLKVSHDRPLVPSHHVGGMIVLGMKMRVFDQAQRADIHHTIFMLIIVIALGAGAAYFIYVINSYYRMNRILRQTQDYTRQVVASLASGLLSINPDGRVVSYNQPALDLLGVSVDQIKTMPLGQILDFAETGIQDTLANGRPNLEKEIRFTANKDRNVPLAVSVTPIKIENDETHGAVIVLRDLSEIKALEAQMRQTEKLAAIGKLAASVAHEIRNPLSSIKGFAKFLHKSIGKNADEGQYAGVIVQEVDRINGVVNDLLTLARPATLIASAVDAVALVDHVIMLVEPDTEARNIRLDRQFSSRIGTIHTDANQLTQALLNLLLNAVQAIGRNGTITVGIGAETRPNYDCIWIKDDGRGISDQHRGRLFDPFFTTRKSGTGLGLAIVHRIVENHHGIIRVESPPRGEKRGSLFSIYLPAHKDMNRMNRTAASEG